MLNQKRRAVEGASRVLPAMARKAAAIELLEPRLLLSTAPSVAGVETGGDITTAGTPFEFIGVVYSDSVAIDPASINASNLITNVPNDVRAVNASIVANTGGLVAVIYTLAPVRTNAWYPIDDANVGVSLNPNAPVRNSAGVAIPAGSLTSFQINIPFENASYGTNGTADVLFTANDSTTDAAGNTVLVGSVTSGGVTGAVIARLTPTGQLDPTFGANGLVVTPGPADTFNSVAIEGSQIVVVGATSGQFLVARYNSDGSLDKFFKEPLFGGFSQEAFGLSVSPTDGTILASGVSGGEFTFFRFLPSGAFDTTFGQGGGQIGNFFLPGGFENVGHTLLEPDGKIVAVGALNNQVVVFRLLSNGFVDPTFNNGVPVIVPGLEASIVSGLPADPTEGLAVVGDQILVANHTADGHFGLVRINSDGSIDTGFGQQGLATANFGGFDDADSIVLQPSGQIVLTGTTVDSQGNGAIAIAAFHADGSTDASFNGTGLLAIGAQGQGASISRRVTIIQNNLQAVASGRNDGTLIVSLASQGPSSGTTTTRRVSTDQTPPAANLAAPSLTIGAPTSYSFTVTYTDETRVNLASIGAANVSITSPSGAPLTVIGATPVASSDSRTVTVTYTVAAPSGHFTSADNGSYSISAGSSLVTDAAGNPASLSPSPFNLALGSATVPPHTSIGSFAGGAKPQKLALTTPAGNLGTITLRGGSGQAFVEADGRTIDLALTNPGTLTVPSGVTLGYVTIQGSLQSLSAPRSNLAGTLSATGGIGKIVLGSIIGGTIAAPLIGSLTAGTMSNAKVLGGTSLGAGGVLGDGQESFAAGSIKSVKVTGSISNSVITAGVAPGSDGAFGTSDDAGAGGGAIGQLTARGADDSSRFEAAAFGAVKLPKRIKVGTDPRVVVL